MVFLRLIGLMLLTAYSFAMGQYSDLNGFGQLVAVMFFVFAPLLYFQPVLEAAYAKHPNTASIGLLNFLLGWTLIGWVVAMVWANKRPEPVALAQGSEEPDPWQQKRATKTCPMCAEEVLAAAIKCKHCGSEISASV